MASSGGKGRKKRKPSKRRQNERAAQLIQALDHSLRRQILRAMHEAEGSISPVKLSELLRMPLGNVSYHVNILRKLDAVSRESERQVRGAMEHFYIPTIDDNAAIMALLDETREGDEAAV